MTSAPTTQDGSKRENAKDSTEPTSGPRRGQPLEKLEAQLGGNLSGDEDLAAMLVQNWQKLVGVIAVVLLIVWLANEYRTAQSRKIGEASQRFQAVQDSFKMDLSLAEAAKPAEPEKEAEKAPDTLGQNSTLLQSTFPESVYSKLAPLYESQAAILKADYSKARSKLSGFNTARFISNKTAAPKWQGDISQEDFVDELAALLQIRLSLAEGNAPRAESRESLATFVERAQFSNVQAVQILFRIAETPEDTEKAKTVARTLNAARPELAEGVKTEMDRMGIKL